MQIIDPTAALTLVVIVGLAALASVVLALVALPAALAVTRRERLGRQETIPTYYGRLHFAH